jgi:hypothetical protein
MLYCNRCQGDTHHELKAIHPKEYYEVQGEPPNESLVYWEKYEYGFWVCLGCDTALLEEAFTFEGMYDPNNKKQIWESALHPKRAVGDLPKKRFRRLSSKLSVLYDEVIECFNGGLTISCAMGLRALMEGICADKDIAGRNLDDKIEGLRAYLPSNIVDNLHGFRFMGNTAAHELQAPKKHELQLAIEVMEDLLNFLYELEYKARGLPKGQA